MLKPLNTRPAGPRNIILWVLVGVLTLSGIIAIIMAFRGGSSGEDEVTVVYTNAAATLAAQQLTLQAGIPSATPTLMATATPAVTATSLVSPTLFATQPVINNTSSAPSGAVGCNNSAYVNDVTFPDDTVVTSGQAMTKTWKLQNTGSCDWTATYKVSFVSGNAMGGTATPIGVSVPAGQSADISISLTAPATAGDAIGYWILTNDDGQNFGSSFYIKVNVGGASTGATATATATGTTASKPNPVDNPDITLSCTLGGTGGTQYEHAGTLTWADQSDNETGFYIYVNGTVIGQAQANATSYTIPSGSFFDKDVTSTFGVAAFNSAGSADTKTVTKKCP